MKCLWIYRLIYVRAYTYSKMVVVLFIVELHEIELQRNCSIRLIGLRVRNTFMVTAVFLLSFEVIRHSKRPNFKGIVVMTTFDSFIIRHFLFIIVNHVQRNRWIKQAGYERE
jgi:hypothetical protein